VYSHVHQVGSSLRCAIRSLTSIGAYLESTNIKCSSEINALVDSKVNRFNCELIVVYITLQRSTFSGNSCLN